MVLVVTMGVWDFVAGILLGIVLACVSLVVQTSRKSAIRGTFSGAVARSTVRRNLLQQRFLREVAGQIHVVKLAGYMFFGNLGTSHVQANMNEIWANRDRRISGTDDS